mmetsp:Transcript_54501/g.177153  ORF Transcript_54501/g.177153 Transcript_54501/m.177153 type:complete len:323 (-) Transcript_54501:243-1211(-)
MLRSLLAQKVREAARGSSSAAGGQLSACRDQSEKTPGAAFGPLSCQDSRACRVPLFEEDGRRSGFTRDQRRPQRGGGTDCVGASVKAVRVVQEKVRRLAARQCSCARPRLSRGEHCGLLGRVAPPQRQLRRVGEVYRSGHLLHSRGGEARHAMGQERSKRLLEGQAASVPSAPARRSRLRAGRDFTVVGSQGRGVDGDLGQGRVHATDGDGELEWRRPSRPSRGSSGRLAALNGDSCTRGSDGTQQNGRQRRRDCPGPPGLARPLSDGVEARSGAVGAAVQPRSCFWNQAVGHRVPQVASEGAPIPAATRVGELGYARSPPD